MTYIKKLVMQGFKSFANKTEIIFDKEINVVVGPNGSGKSNISDCLCFVLGRLSIKSMRAAKAKNLIFMGSKYVKPAKEAWGEIVFDNTKRTFNIDSDEIIIKRIVRHNGQSIYKINGETKTRAEVIEMLAHAGIDPHGFNLILQGQIQAIVKMHPEDRRKIIEEVAGISIYESRKEKSLHELEKTEEKLKEISAVLRERRAFLNNLEKERAQALKFKELEESVKRCKASILNRKIDDKSKELESLRRSIEEKMKLRDKARQHIFELQQKIESYNEEINKINKHIQKSTGLEQESLHEAITNLRAELEGLKVRLENYHNRKLEMENRIEQIKSSIPELEAEIKDLRKESPLVAKKQEELKKKKKELEIIEEEKKKVYSLRTELNNLKERVREKEHRLTRTNSESDSLLKHIEEMSSDLKYNSPESLHKALKKIETDLEASRKSLNSLVEDELKNTKIISSSETIISQLEKIKENVRKIDTCPLCQNKMTPSHISHVLSDSDKKIDEAKKNLAESSNNIEKIKEERAKLFVSVKASEKAFDETQREETKHRIIADKQQYLKKLTEEAEVIKKEIGELSSKRDALERKSSDLSQIEHEYSSKLREIEEISSRTEKDLDTSLLYKERELEQSQDIIKRSTKDLDEIQEDIEEIESLIESKTQMLEQKEEEEKSLSERFKQMFKQRDELQQKVQEESLSLSTNQGESSQIEEQINYLKIGNAKLDAEREALEMEMRDYIGIELIKGSIAFLEERLEKAKQSIALIGSINLRALEVYDDIKTEYDRVQEKVDTLEKEKTEILKIIEEIDKKKKKTFMKTFSGINDLFSRNFSQLYTKGKAFLEIENKEDLFAGGINIVIRLAKGKYFDVTSLSGGEQTLIALSLLFAIQEYKPYHFYIFDEIDAALDKRNSERLSALLKKYMTSGQYIIVTHNDAIITDSNYLYGVSMHDGVSKILSLKLD